MRLAPIAALLCLVLCFGALPASADSVDAAVANARGGGLGIQADAEATANASAARQAANLAIGHASISHLTSVCSRAAEIVGAGPSVDLVFAGFRASPSHWSKLTDPGWTSMGTGMAQGSDGRLYISVVFCQGAGGGSSAPAPAPAPGPTPQPTPRPGPTGTPSTGSPAPTVEPVQVEVDLVGLLTAILGTSLDSLTASDEADNPMASLLGGFVSLPTGVTIV